MLSHRLSVALGLTAALAIAALFSFLALDAPGEQDALARAGHAIWRTFAYGLAPAVIALAATELVRIRHIGAHIALGLATVLVAAILASIGEPIGAPIHSGGALTALASVALGVLASAAYWFIAGRRAGWRGDAIETADVRAITAFQRASSNAYVEPRAKPLAIWAAACFAVFAALGWSSIEASGLRAQLVEEASAHARATLDAAGHSWATFGVDGNRGVLAGLAPDELNRLAADDSIRDALSAVVGFPGVFATIENEAAAAPATDVPEQLADVARRESEANAAAEAARLAMIEARAAEAEARRQAEQAAISEAETKRKLEEQARAASELAALQAEAAPASDAADVAAPQPQMEAKADIDAAPVDTDADLTDTSSEDHSAPTLPAGCTAQDLAVIKSSIVLFDMQWFGIAPSYEGELDRLAASAKACTPHPILVTGYSDADGDSLFNETLGQQRALAVRQQLVDRGVDPQLVLAKAAADGFTAHRGKTIEERALNRRTEFKLLAAAEVSRDATQSPDTRASNCQDDLTDIMAQSIIHFRTASARISEESSELISRLAGAIQTCGSVIVTVEGHTDKVGDDASNQQLSDARANTVREALVLAGADPTRLQSRGFSSSQPYDPANTLEAFAMNRRIEFKVSGKFTSTNVGGP